MPATLPQITLMLANEDATSRLAGALAPCIRQGFTIFLSGDLGTGKTAFTRALLRALGHTGRVRSPTFTLAESYNFSSFDLYHFDFYRFSDENEWRDAGFEEFIGAEHATVVEWPELAGTGLPAPDLWLRLRSTDDEGARLVDLHAHTEAGQACLNRLANTLRETGIAGVGCWAPSAPPSSA